jgi:Mg2+-importing ATPase
LSFFLVDAINASIILTIILISSILGFWQKRVATNAVNKLLAIVQTKATVFRDGTLKDIHVEEIVPGDVISLRAGDLIPGDASLHSLVPIDDDEEPYHKATAKDEKEA